MIKNIQASARAAIALEYEEFDPEIGSRNIVRLLDPEAVEIVEEPFSKMLELRERYGGETILLFLKRAEGESVRKLLDQLCQMRGQALHRIESQTGEVTALAKTQAEAIEAVMLTAGVKGVRACATTPVKFGV